MIKKNPSANERRSRNIIWNAAGSYDIEPYFLAYFPDGTQDLYLDMIIGLAYKWFDMDRLSDFFSRYEHVRRAEEFDAMLWLGLENCLFEKELPGRPVMRSLRHERGELFFENREGLSRQQMMYQSMPLFTQQEARWADACGRKRPVMSLREKRISESLRFEGSLDTEGVTERMRDFLKEYYRFDPYDVKNTSRTSHPLSFLFRREHKRKDTFLLRAGEIYKGHPKAVSLHHDGLGRFAGISKEDTGYIRDVFGECILPEREMNRLENEVCTGDDAPARIWISKKSPAERPAKKETAEIIGKRLRQKEKNDAYLKEHSMMVRSSIRALKAHMDTALSSFLRPLPEKAKTGALMSSQAYRLPVLNDPRVFLKDGDEIEAGIVADILLDASQSRMHAQESIAAEAYIIASSLVSLGIPVRVMTFRSIRGYTVLEVLKETAEKDCSGVMSYYAGGWNRDSLAIKTAGSFAPQGITGGTTRLMLVLTDANPNDSTPVGRDGLRSSAEYEGIIAVKDTEEAVIDLKDKGIRTGAVFHGNPAHLCNAQQIYGNDYVQIRNVNQLARGAGTLLLKLICTE